MAGEYVSSTVEKSEALSNEVVENGKEWTSSQQVCACMHVRVHAVACASTELSWFQNNLVLYRCILTVFPLAATMLHGPWKHWSNTEWRRQRSTGTKRSVE